MSPKRKTNRSESALSGLPPDSAPSPSPVASDDNAAAPYAGLSDLALRILLAYVFDNPRCPFGDLRAFLERHLCRLASTVPNRGPLIGALHALSDASLLVLGASAEAAAGNTLPAPSSVRLAAPPTIPQACALLRLAGKRGLLETEDYSGAASRNSRFNPGFLLSLSQLLPFLEGRCVHGLEFSPTVRRNPFGGYYGYDDYIPPLPGCAFWNLAARLDALFAPGAPASLRDLSSFPALSSALLVRLASLRFHRSADVSDILDLWRGLLATPAGLKASSPAELAEYAALCVFAGRRAHLDVLPGGTHPFADACRALLDPSSNPAAVHKRLSAAVDNLAPDGYNPDYIEQTLVTPAAHLLALLETAFRKPAKTRIQHLAVRLTGIDRQSYATPPVVSRLNAFRRSSSWTPPFLNPTFLKWKNPDFFALPKPLPAAPVAQSGRLAQVLLSLLRRPEAESIAPSALALAERSARSYPTLAAAWLAAFAPAFPRDLADRAADLAPSLDAAGAFWFRPFDAPDESWRNLLDALSRALPSASSLRKSDSGVSGPAARLIWRLDLEVAPDTPPDAKDPVQMMCYGVSASLRAPDAPEDGSHDRRLSFSDLKSGRYDANMSPADSNAFSHLLRAKDSYSSWAYPRPTAEFFEALCDAPNLAIPVRRPISHTRLSPADFSAPVSLTLRDIPLAARSTPDGGVRLSVERWCLAVKTDFAIRRDAPDAFSFIRFPKRARSTLAVFATYGDSKRGDFDIPPAGLPAFRALLPRLAAVAPVQGELSSVADTSSVPRLPGDPSPLVRLAYDPDAPALSLALRVKPLSDSPFLVLPGEGLPERLVPRNGRSAVLVRDLDAERNAAAPVLDALAPFDAWSAEPGEWTVGDLSHMLRALDALRALGPAVRLEWLSPRKLSVAAPSPGSWRLSAVGGADFWFSVDADFDLDDGTHATLSALLEAFAHRRGEFVPFGDSAYIRLSAALARRLEALSAAGHLRKGRLDLPPTALPFVDAAFDPAADAEAGLAFPPALAKRAAEVRDAFALPVPLPPRLKATLRPYQIDGFTWLSRLAAAGFGACLADDMGLGKTLQIIALLLARAADGPSLVVAPASVCGNWRDELARFAPTLNPVMAWDAGPDETAAALAAARPGDVVIAPYGLLVSRADAFAARPWNGAVLDEAQAIKNEETKRARAARRLAARFRVAATGTPVENRLSDVWSLFEFLNPGLLGTPAEFVRRFTSDGRPSPSLKRLLSPLILRRVKRDVLDDLPEKTEITLPVLLSPEERAGYETVRRRALQTLEQTGGKDNRISILAELTRLRRYCCHPSLVLGPEAQIPAAKLDALLDLLANLRDNGHRALVFSQFTDFLAIVRRALDAAGFPHLYLDGATPSAERARLVDSFQRGTGDFFLVSLKAGGLGLNLTAANYVILLDPWWNPAVEQQAADRAHRIGQKRPVTVYRLVAQDTVEERVLALHAEKKALSADLLSDASSPALTPDLLLSLFS